MTSPSSPGNAKAADRPRLTEAQKKENHIRSEQKRREAIREGFDKLAAIVPGMEGQGRSEAAVLEATLKYMRDEIMKRKRLIAEAQAKGLDTTTWELERATMESCERQLRRNQAEQAKKDLEQQ